MKLDDFRVCVVPGDGIVARLDGAVLVVPFGGPIDQAAVDRLLDECRTGSLGPRLAEVRASASGVPAFALVAEVDGGLAVHVEGDTHAAIAGAAPVLHLSGRAPGWSNVFREPFAALAVGHHADALGQAPARLDLKAGVVAGAGVLLVPMAPVAAVAAPMAAPMPVAVPVEPVAPAAPVVAQAMAPAPAAPAAPMEVMAPVPVMAPPAPSAPIPQPAPAAPAPAPVLPEPPAPVAVAAMTTPAQPPAAPAEPEPAEVWGVRCKKGHFNDPESRYCAVCGIHMVQDKAVRVRGPRPVLGYLVFDDGKTYKLDTDYVIGRAPQGDDAVLSGHARPLVFGAGEEVISEVHARVILRDWDVLVADCHSLYGTYVWAPGSAAWERLATDEPVTLTAGSQVMLAQRGFMFQPVNKR